MPLLGAGQRLAEQTQAQRTHVVTPSVDTHVRTYTIYIYISLIYRRVYMCVFVNSWTGSVSSVHKLFCVFMTQQLCRSKTGETFRTVQKRQ